MSAPMLTGKTAMVTGAGGAIGRAFASASAKVACLDIDLAAAEKTAGASGNEAIAQHCDVSSEIETRDAAAATISKFKAVHILVNAAATDDRNGTILDITAEERSRLVVVNVTGAFLVSRAVLPSMIAAGGQHYSHRFSAGPCRRPEPCRLLHLERSTYPAR
jgi:3-oxoacyl-[acyl-carrier protein] reductase